MAKAVTLDRLRADLRTYARLAGTRYDPAVTEPVLTALEHAWTTAAVGVRTTTHPAAQREVNVRVMYPGALGALVESLGAAGLLPRRSDPRIMPLLDALCESLPAAVGVDLAIGSGIQKVWAVLPEIAEVGRVLELPGLPAAVRTHAAHLSRWGGRIGIVAVDFPARTLNLYSQVLDPALTGADIGAILAELGFGPASAAELAVLDGRAFNLYRTFSWDSPRPERVSFPVRCRPETFPTHLHPLLTKIVAEAPFADPDARRGFVFYAAYGPNGLHYYKIQAEYCPGLLAPTFPGGVAPAVR
ncbi:hypothetical protein D5S18_22415 [Nocardia panacis]|uniref:Prenyltransferase n=1 Tax=Nocardia panacis TaxID=2340916 RepID=A0A3A4K5V2_9NOCA|nr:aromatic prenyltransferase [Nocardia panacis]RJO72530.1 hypothetical protein D5S18_22415 [Nocardia panacis]